MSVMTANQSRVLIAVGALIVGAAILIPVPGFLESAFGWIAGAVLLFLAVFEVKDWLADRREDRDAVSKSTAIQVLPLRDADEPVTFHFPEGGEMR